MNFKTEIQIIALCKSPKLETIQVLPDYSRLHKYTVVYLHNGILLCRNENE